MTIAHSCGSHCGIRSNAEGTVVMEGHCNGPGCCHDGSWSGPAVTRVNVSPGSEHAAPRGPDGQPLAGTPMCARWYERAGTTRPWHPQAVRTITDATLVSVDIRPDAVPYQQSPPSALAGPGETAGTASPAGA